MRAKEIRSATFAEWLGATLRRLGRSWAANRERARVEKVAKELLLYDDRLLEDVGLSRRVLEAALRDPETYRNLEDLRRDAGAEEETLTGRLREPSARPGLAAKRAA